MLTVLHDTEPPVISGVKDICAYVGNQIDYESGILVSDDHDENVKLKIDSSAVNMKAGGSYPLTYSAVDSAGNTVSVGVTVNVMEQGQFLYDSKCPYELHVNKQANVVTVYVQDENGDYTIPYTAFVCSCGGSATPEGTFHISNKYEWRALIHNMFGQYACRIHNRILFHSVPYSSESKDALIAEEYNKLGETASAGCVRLSVADAKWIYDNCPSGTTVVIYSSSEPGALGKPDAEKISEDCGWDPTDPDPSNPLK